MDVHPSVHPGEAPAQAQPSGWWPLDCLRSLGRAASIASGQAGQSIQQHADYRGFRILTTGQDSSYAARITHWQGEVLGVGRQLQHTLDNTRFASHDEAAQHARFLITSGAFNHLRTAIRA